MQLGFGPHCPLALLRNKAESVFYTPPACPLGSAQRKDCASSVWVRMAPTHGLAARPAGLLPLPRPSHLEEPAGCRWSKCFTHSTHWTLNSPWGGCCHCHSSDV